MMRSRVLLASCLFCCWQSPPQAAVEWNQYRGPNHDGVSTEPIRTDWAQTPPRTLWKKSVEPGLSSFSVGGGKVFTQMRRRSGAQETEFCVALDADTGTELWAAPVGIAFYPNGGVGFDDGPRSTPSVDGDRVYVVSSYLQVLCFEADTGKQIWARDLEAELGARVIPWQNAASPLIKGDLLFLNSNIPNQSLLALRKENGTVAWQAHSYAMTQASPVFATIAGRPQVIFFTQSGLISVVPESGQLLWHYSFPYSVSTAASPVVAGDTVYGSAAYGIGAGTARVGPGSNGWTVQELWRTPGNNMNHWATPVYHEGHFYGVYGHSFLTLRCIDAANGQEKWREPGVGYGSVLLVDGNLLVLTEQGMLILAKPDPANYREITRFQAVTGKSWNVPAIDAGRIYVRSTTEAAAYDVSPPAPPPVSKPALRLITGFIEGPSALRFRIATENGTPLDSSRASKIEVLTTDELSESSRWVRLNYAPTLKEGQLEIEIRNWQAQQFFKAQETP